MSLSEHPSLNVFKHTLHVRVFKQALNVFFHTPFKHPALDLHLSSRLTQAVKTTVAQAGRTKHRSSLYVPPKHVGVRQSLGESLMRVPDL